jgi:hypothetical protein
MLVCNGNGRGSWAAHVGGGDLVRAADVEFNRD